MREVREDITTIKNKLGGLDDLGSKSSDTSGKVKELQDAIDDINEKVWELDKSWKNNLVFYGLRQDAGSDEHPSVTESKVIINNIYRFNQNKPSGVYRVSNEFMDDFESTRLLI